MHKTNKNVEKPMLSGAGVVEVLLIMVVLIAVVVFFKEQITLLAETIFGDIFAKAGSVF